MKHDWHIPLAIGLILLGIWGCFVNSPRFLSDCLPEGQWESVTCREQVLSTQEIQALMEGTVVSHRAAWQDFDEPYLPLLIQIDGATHLVELSGDGRIAVADPSHPEKTRTFWQDAGGELYQTLSGTP